MDLLGGYDSNSSSDSDDEESNVQAPPLSPTAKKTRASSRVAAKTNVPIEASNKKKQGSTRRGKRLLKLQAVLPEHIWNQLSNGASAAQEDSDDDYDANENKNTKRDLPKKQESLASKARQTPEDKSELSNLLLALPKSKTGNNILGNKSFLGQDTSSPVISSKPSSSTPLGSAFLTSTVETIRTKQSTFRDIHGNSLSSKRVAVETVEDGDEEDDQEEKRNRLAASAPPPRPTATRPSVRVASSISAARSAAPFVASRYQQPPSYPVPSAPTQTSARQFQSQKASSNHKKSRKRQMEELLRQGNFDGVTSDVHLRGQDNVYQMPQEQNSASYQSHGVRVVPTAQYNVGSGTTTASVNISGKQRGKNQVNALLASAASLEAQRARNPLQQQTIHRANAKRKYGW